jgi:hypothetical protein
VHLYRRGLFHHSLIPAGEAACASGTAVAAVCDRRSNISGSRLKSDVTERLRRLEYKFRRLPIYFITACTHERPRILNNVEVHARLVEFGWAGNDRGAWLGAYVLMPDYFHAFVIIDNARLSLSIRMKSLKNSISKTLRALAVSSPHWQKGFLTTFCTAVNPNLQSGIMFGRTRCGLD